MKRILLLLGLVVVGCSKSPTKIEPTEITCKEDYLKKIDDLEQRQQLGSACLLRGTEKEVKSKDYNWKP